MFCTPNYNYAVYGRSDETGFGIAADFICNTSLSFIAFASLEISSPLHFFQLKELFFFLGISCWNPAFDVTPASLIAGIITELGVFKPSDLAVPLEKCQSIVK